MKLIAKLQPMMRKRAATQAVSLHHQGALLCLTLGGDGLVLVSENTARKQDVKASATLSPLHCWVALS